MQLICNWILTLWPGHRLSGRSDSPLQGNARTQLGANIGEVPASRPPSRRRNWLRRVHALIGVVAAFNLLLLIVTGMLLQHRELFRLDEHVVSRKLLPASYRPQDGVEVRADIVVADLHSGRLFGRPGALALDAVTLGWFLLLVTGLVIYTTGMRRRRNGDSGVRGSSAGGSAAAQNNLR